MYEVDVVFTKAFYFDRGLELRKGNLKSPLFSASQTLLASSEPVASHYLKDTPGTMDHQDQGSHREILYEQAFVSVVVSCLQVWRF